MEKLDKTIAQLEQSTARLQEHALHLNVEQQVSNVLLMSLILTHPHRDELQRVFEHGYERCIAAWLAGTYPDAWFEHAAEYRKALLKCFYSPPPGYGTSSH
ncbi:hypothetical protein [Paraburkholderia aspalathi]|uniref:hypothetical protein n=1 Tax=Paraburkholderia aspalathi TaxID=1324617 RepID=UPI0038BA496F